MVLLINPFTWHKVSFLIFPYASLPLVRSGQLTDSDIEELREFFKIGGDGK